MTDIRIIPIGDAQPLRGRLPDEIVETMITEVIAEAEQARLAKLEAARDRGETTMSDRKIISIAGFEARQVEQSAMPISSAMTDVDLARIAFDIAYDLHFTMLEAVIDQLAQQATAHETATGDMDADSLEGAETFGFGNGMRAAEQALRDYLTAERASVALQRQARNSGRPERDDPDAT